MGIKLRGFDIFRRAFDRKRVKRTAQTELGKKIQQQLVLLRGDIIEYINAEKHGVPNSPLTILIKGSSRPLVDYGDLRQSINTRVVQEGEFVHGGVGVLRTRKSRDGKKLWNIAAALHEGYKIRVTPAVRRAVFAEMRKRQRKRKRVAFEGGSGAKTWVVKGRPFIKDPLEAAKPRIIRALGKGVEITMMEI